MRTTDGSVELRPARVAFIADEWTRELLLKASGLATTVWGGLHYPMFRSGDAGLRRALEIGAIDVVHAIDRADESNDLGPGFQWRGRAEFGPFAPPHDTFATRLLGHHLLERHGSSALAPMVTWRDDERLHDLFCLWFGRFPEDAYAAEQSAVLSAERSNVGVLPEQLPPMADVAGPIAWTTTCIDYTGDGGKACVVLLEPDDVEALRFFWNLRAHGSSVFPWVPSSASRLRPGLDLWMESQRGLGRLHEWKSGDGSRSGRFVGIAQGDSCSDADQQDFISYVKERHDLDAWDEHGLGDSRGWLGQHPFNTDIERSFSVEVSASVLSVPMPSVPWIDRRRRHTMPGVITAQVRLHGTHGDDARQDSIAVPAIRRLASLLASNDGPFARPTGEGVALAVQASAESVSIPRVGFDQLFREFFEPAGWTVGQSKEGRVSTQVIRLLGGYESMDANQPAVRAVLQAAARDVRAKPLPVLLEEARKRRGEWPDDFGRVDERRYANRVVYRLLNQRLLRPVLPVTCPRCSTIEDFRPEDVLTEMTCGLCAERFALGLALAITGKSATWHYKLAPHIAPAQLQSTLPVMATMSVLQGLPRTSHTVSPLLGLTLKDGDWACEVDVAALIADGPGTVLVAGEVKSWRDDISQQDLENLLRVAHISKSQLGVECVVLAATLRDRLSDEERQALRRLCEDLGRRGFPHNSLVCPSLPLVFTGPDLSLPWLSEEAPWRWGRSHSDYLLADLAEASCKRNLGLESWDHKESDNDFRFTWAD